MIISIVNRTETLGDAKVHVLIRAINKQIAYDFEAYWSLGAEDAAEATLETHFARRGLPWHTIQISRPNPILRVRRRPGLRRVLFRINDVRRNSGWGGLLPR